MRRRRVSSGSGGDPLPVWDEGGAGGEGEDDDNESTGAPSSAPFASPRTSHGDLSRGSSISSLVGVPRVSSGGTRRISWAAGEALERYSSGEAVGADLPSPGGSSSGGSGASRLTVRLSGLADYRDTPRGSAASEQHGRRSSRKSPGVWSAAGGRGRRSDGFDSGDSDSDATSEASYDDEEEAEEAALRHSAETCMALHVLAAAAPPAAAALAAARQRARWAAAGGAAGARAADAAAAGAGTLCALLALLAALLALRSRAWPLAAVRAWPHLLLLAAATSACVTDAVFFAEAVALRPSAPSTPPGAAAHAFFWTALLPALSLLPWLAAQLPLSQVVPIQALRAALFLAMCLAAQGSGHVITAAFALRSAAMAVLAAVVPPLACALAYAPPPAVSALLDSAGADACPRPLRSGRDAAARAAMRLRWRLLPAGPPLLDANGGLAVTLATVAGLAEALLRAHSDISPAPRAFAAGATAAGVLLASGALARLRPPAAPVPRMSSAHGLAASAAAAEAAELEALRARVAAADSEDAILRAGADALKALFPTALAAAVGAFAPGAPADAVAALELSAADVASEAALRSALPSDVGRAPAPGSRATSVARVCHPSLPRVALLDSAHLPEDEAAEDETLRLGVGACPDWAAASQAGLVCGRALTAQLGAGPVVVGFVQLHLPPGRAAFSRAALRELCDAVGGALFVRRAFAVGSGLAERRASERLPQQTSGGGYTQPASADGSADHAAASAGAAAAGLAPKIQHTVSGRLMACRDTGDEEALAALDATLAGDAALLRSWSLDAWALPDDEIQRLMVSMLHAAGLLRRFRIPAAAAHAFAAGVAAAMPESNSFHNVRHVFCVAQTAFRFLIESHARAALLHDLDALALLLAAMCHDLEHPGTTNAFQVNTGSALAIRYNDASVLENHHAATGYALLDACGMLAPLSGDERRSLRRTMVDAVLATDMSKHKDLLSKVSVRVGAARAQHVLTALAPVVVDDATRGGVRAARTSSWTAGSGSPLVPASAPPAAPGPRISWADGGGGLVPTVASGAASPVVQTPPPKPQSPAPLRTSMSMPIRRRPSMNVALAAAAAAAMAHMTTPPPHGSADAPDRQAPAGAAASPTAAGMSAPAPRPPSVPGILSGSAPRRSQSVVLLPSNGSRGSGASPYFGASSAFNRDSAEDRQLLVAFMLHCADLCTPLLPPPLSVRATEALGREFAAQAKAERAAGLPVTVMLADDPASKAKLELGFIDYAVHPLYAALVGIFPELSGCLSLIDRNRSAWGAAVAAEAAAEAHTPPHDATPASGRPKEA
jgi:hypothetical protein